VAVFEILTVWPWGKFSAYIDKQREIDVLVLEINYMSHCYQ